MALKVYYEAQAPVAPILGKTVALIGYGNQGAAQACNLRDSGVKVVIGIHDLNDPTAQQATKDGFPVMLTAKAVKQADVVMMLVPDEFAPQAYKQSVARNLKPGAMLMFAHGFNIHFGYVKPADNIDVTMIAPKGPGHTVRSQFLSGAGVPCLVAVHQNATGKALEMALAYGAAIGGARAGIIETTYKEETETDLFGEQCVLCGGLSELIKNGFDTLVEAGYTPELAYFECLHEVKLIVDLMVVGGLSYMRHAISNTAEYGDYVTGPKIIGPAVKKKMQAALKNIQNGKFAKAFRNECKKGKPFMTEKRQQEYDLNIEKVGRNLRKMMKWLDSQDVKAEG